MVSIFVILKVYIIIICFFLFATLNFKEDSYSTANITIFYPKFIVSGRYIFSNFKYITKIQITEIGICIIDSQHYVNQFIVCIVAYIKNILTHS